jgi:hypothetical protein
MTNKEMIAILSGGISGKIALFNAMTERLVNGDSLADNEVSIFETLKRDLIIPEPTIVQMEANLTGNSSQRIE